MSEITLTQRFSTTADISHCETFNRDREIKFLSPAAHSLPQFRRYFPSYRHQEQCLQSASSFSVKIKFPKHCISVQQQKVQLMLR